MSQRALTLKNILPLQEPTTKQKLGAQLVEQKLLTSDQLQVALREQQRVGGRLGDVLVTLQLLTSQQLTTALAQQQNSPVVDIKAVAIDVTLVEKLDETVVHRHQLLPYAKDSNRLLVAMADPYDVIAIDKVRAHFPAHEIVPMLADARDLADVISVCCPSQLPALQLLEQLEQPQALRLHTKTSGQAPVIAFIDQILQEAAGSGASDIHFEPEQQFTRVRFRHDGLLHQHLLLHRDHWQATAQRLKIMATMNIANSGYPEDGRFTFTHAGRTIDCRVALLPTVWGDNIVIRLLDHKQGLLPLTKLGFSSKHLALLDRMLRRPQGLILVTGPTGAGKTTTLYALVQEISDTTLNVMTLEEPVEYRLSLIRQTQVREQQGLTFAAGVRAIMRQDPDVILIGEIRDAETAQMAMRAAMTGHRVLATLHTNDAFGVIPRLTELGVPASVLAEQLTGVIAQRLVRTLCPSCKTTAPVTIAEAHLLGMRQQTGQSISHPKGCSACEQTGYRGRTIVGEVLRLSQPMRDLIATNSPLSALRHQAFTEQFTDLVTDGTEKVLAQLITLDNLADTVDLTERM